MLYEIRSSPLKGQGIFTTQPIPRGTTIISEPPLLSAPRNSPGFLHAYDSLSADTREKFHTLYNKYDDSDPRNRPAISRAEGIWITNRFSIGYCVSAVFENICKFNHSCRPNAKWIWRPHGVMEVVAVRDLVCGEEVLVSYLYFGEGVGVVSRRERMAVWNFVCRCERCVAEEGTMYSGYF